MQDWSIQYLHIYSLFLLVAPSEPPQTSNITMIKHFHRPYEAPPAINRHSPWPQLGRSGPIPQAWQLPRKPSASCRRKCNDSEVREQWVMWATGISWCFCFQMFLWCMWYECHEFKRCFMMFYVEHLWCIYGVGSVSLMSIGYIWLHHLFLVISCYILCPLVAWWFMRMVIGDW